MLLIENTLLIYREDLEKIGSKNLLYKGSTSLNNLHPYQLQSLSPYTADVNLEIAFSMDLK